MDMHQIRLKNLLLVIEKAGSQARLADYVGIKSSYISQIKSPKHPTNMGNDIARRIEKAMNLPFGWMDHLHDEPETLPNCLDYAPANAPVLDEKTAMMIEMFKHLTESQKADLLRVMEEKKQQNEQLLNELLARKA